MRRMFGGRVLVAMSIFGLAACLRPALTAVGPLLPDISASTGLSYGTLGFLGSLPLLLFAAVAPFGAVALRYGTPAVVARWVALILVLGILVRSLAGVPGLWLGTMLLAGAIAIGNVLVPVLVRRDYPERAAIASGGSALIMSAFAAVGSGLAIVFTEWTGDWRSALALWAIPAVAVAAIWWLRRHDRPEQQFIGAATQRASQLRRPVAWAVTAFMGLQSLSFYLVINWMPSIEMSRGVSADDAALHLLIYQLFGAPFGLVVSWFLQRTGRYVLITVLTSLPVLIGAVGVLSTDGSALPWLVIAAPGSAGALSIALLLMAYHAADSREAAGLSAMANCGGYLLAATGPFTAGLTHEWTGSWTPALILFATAATLQVAVAIPASRRSRPSA
ncbi:transmembrane transporter [Mycolicibacterium tokaiense]|uniref:Transmembrane transporter n=2 Tax=Mycolicibacterium tokaiense TaxID=39695 RepID=A0A378TLG9_9MYCO|nr:MFS transporter [Mycolicibacterium tokaiense]STZ60456.1 transmembrane transporter [Mycolicibacterium tokaiense]